MNSCNELWEDVKRPNIWEISIPGKGVGGQKKNNSEEIMTKNFET